MMKTSHQTRYNHIREKWLSVRTRVAIASTRFVATVYEEIHIAIYTMRTDPYAEQIKLRFQMKDPLWYSFIAYRAWLTLTFGVVVNTRQRASITSTRASVDDTDSDTIFSSRSRWHDYHRFLSDIFKIRRPVRVYFKNGLAGIFLNATFFSHHFHIIC